MLSSYVNNWSEFSNIMIEDHVSHNMTLNSLRETMYICRISQTGYRPIIGLINLIDYQDFPSRIVPHERVNKEKVNDYIKQFASGNTLNNPILLFYKKFPEFQRYLNKIISPLKSINVFSGDKIYYEIFPINKTEIIKETRAYLNKIKKLYVADGHHRINALLELQAQLSSFSQFYLSFLVEEGDLNLGSFNRFIKGVNVNIEALIKILKNKYLINQVPPESLNPESDIYMYASKAWYQLRLIGGGNEDKFTTLPPVHVDKFIISELITHFPLTGKILSYPTTERIDDTLHFYKQNQCQIAIIVPSLSLTDLFNLTKEAYILPSHSTNFTPKIPNNLFIQKINFPSRYLEGIAV